MAVGLRVPRVVVDAVEDADDVAAAVAQRAVEALAPLRRLDLAGVARRDRGHEGGVVDAALEEVEVVERLQAAGVELAPGELRLVVLGPGEPALVRHVVDGEDRGGGGGGRAGLERVQVDGDEPGLPVVDVDDVGHPAQRAAEAERAAREQRVAGQVVEVGAARVAVDAVAIVEGVVLQQVDARVAAREARLPHGAPRLPVADRHGEGRGVALCRMFAGDAVPGEHHAHVVPALREGDGQGPRHVGEAARLGEGNALGDDEEDVEARHWAGVERPLLLQVARPAWTERGEKKAKPPLPAPERGGL